MAGAGYTEIQLLGQNVNSYCDPSGKKSFAELLAAVGEVPGIRRVRFTTSHPRDFGRDIVEAIDSSSTLCDHVHLPVQSGSSRVLDLMQRLYDREQYLERIGWIKSARRKISITTDVIVGFPGETEADFAETLSLLDVVEYDGIFAFKYSPRPNTPALKFIDAIADQEKARRLAILNEKQREIQRRNYQKHVGEIVEVMVEGHNPTRGQWIGRTSQNKTLNFVAPEAITPKIGSYARTRVTASFPNSLVGELVGDLGMGRPAPLRDASHQVTEVSYQAAESSHQVTEASYQAAQVSHEGAEVLYQGTASAVPPEEMSEPRL